MVEARRTGTGKNDPASPQRRRRGGWGGLFLWLRWCVAVYWCWHGRSGYSMWCGVQGSDALVGFGVSSTCCWLTTCCLESGTSGTAVSDTASTGEVQIRPYTSCQATSLFDCLALLWTLLKWGTSRWLERLPPTRDALRVAGRVGVSLRYHGGTVTDCR